MVAPKSPVLTERPRVYRVVKNATYSFMRAHRLNDISHSRCTRLPVQTATGILII